METTRERTPMEPTKISWNLGYTMQPRQYESLRIDCSVTDYKHDDETVSEASERVYKFVEDQLIQKLKEAREELS